MKQSMRGVERGHWRRKSRELTDYCFNAGGSHRDVAPHVGRKNGRGAAFAIIPLKIAVVGNIAYSAFVGAAGIVDAIPSDQAVGTPRHVWIARGWRGKKCFFFRMTAAESSVRC